MTAKTGLKSAARIIFGTAILAALSLLFMLPPAHASGVDDKNNEVVIEKAPTPEEALERFTTNITKVKRNGGLEPFVGERVFIRQVQEVMSKKGTKVLWVTGEAGSGKTAAIKHASDNIGAGRELYELNVNALEAGTGYRGTFEDRLKSILEAFVGRPDRVLMIDEVHVAMKIQGFMDKFKPAMASGQLSAILITTDMEFERDIAPDDALTGRGPRKGMAAPTLEKAITILRANQARLEAAHGVKFAPEALMAAARLAQRHYPGQSLNRRALEIADLTAGRKNLAVRYGSLEMLEKQDKLESAKFELAAIEEQLLQRTGKGSIAEVFQDGMTAQGDTIERMTTNSTGEAGDLIERYHTLKTQTGALEDAINLELKSAEAFRKQEQLKEFKAQLEAALKIVKTGSGADKSVAEQTVTELTKFQIPTLESDLRALGADVAMLGESGTLITQKDIEIYVARDKGVPAKIVAGSDRERFNYLVDEMGKRVQGNAGALKVIQQRLKMRIANMIPPGQPAGVFLLDGTRASGRTTITKAIAEGYFGSDMNVITVDLGSYSAQDQARLIGHTHGIVDASRGGDLERLRLHPYSVVVFKNAQNAPPGILSMLSDALSKGVMIDARGKTLDFRNAVVIFQGSFTGDYQAMRDSMSTAQIEKMFDLNPGTLNGMSRDAIDAYVLETALRSKRWPSDVMDSVTGKFVLEKLAITQLSTVGQKIVQEIGDYARSEHGIRVEFGPGVGNVLAKLSYNPYTNAGRLQNEAINIVGERLTDFKMDDLIKAGSLVEIKVQVNNDNSAMLVYSIDGKVADRQIVAFPEAQPVVAPAETPVKRGKGAAAKLAGSKKAKTGAAGGEAGRVADPTDTSKVIEREMARPRKR